MSDRTYTAIFILLIAFQIKHWLADYPFQGHYMLGKFEKFPKFIKPLLAHASVHAAFTFFITLLIFPLMYVLWFPMHNEGTFWHGLHMLMTRVKLEDYGFSLILATKLALLDGAIHFVVDRLKASPDIGGRWTALSKREMMQIKEDLKYFKEYPYSNTTIQTMPQTMAKLKSNTYFWWALGADQTAHHLTHYLLIYFIVAGL